MASWFDARMVAVVLLVAGACAHPPPSGIVQRDYELEALYVENQRLEEEGQFLKELNADLHKLIDEQKFELAQGVVLTVKDSGNVGIFVAISVGRKHGVRLGDEYHISRGKSYVGRIDIIRVSEYGAIGRLHDKFGSPNPPPQVGDKAWVD